MQTPRSDTTEPMFRVWRADPLHMTYHDTLPEARRVARIGERIEVRTQEGWVTCEDRPDLRKRGGPSQSISVRLPHDEYQTLLRYQRTAGKSNTSRILRAALTAYLSANAKEHS